MRLPRVCRRPIPGKGTAAQSGSWRGEVLLGTGAQQNAWNLSCPAPDILVESDRDPASIY